MQSSVPLVTSHIIACGALANELFALKKLNHWDHMEISCLPAKYHQTPDLISEAVREQILKIKTKNRANKHKIFIAYGDCGTGGELDKVLFETQTKRLPGAHCYQFFAGEKVFNDLTKAEVGTFYLTDFLTRHFDSYVWKALWLDRNPELRDLYFGNYKKLVYLAQTDNQTLTKKAQECANKLGLTFKRVFTGYTEMETALQQLLKPA